MRANGWKLLVTEVALLCLAFGVAACGHGEYPPPVGEIVTYSASATVSAEPDFRATQAPSCGAGEQMLAGGYSATDVFESAFFLDASYPSTTTTWTISAHSISHFDLQAFVYCLRDGPSLGARIVQGNICPVGTNRLSQGKRDSTLYTLCVAYDVKAGATPGDFQVGAFAAHCANTATGSSLSETRSFSYTCQFHQAQA